MWFCERGHRSWTDGCGRSMGDGMGALMLAKHAWRTVPLLIASCMLALFAGALPGVAHAVAGDAPDYVAAQSPAARDDVDSLWVGGMCLVGYDSNGAKVAYDSTNPAIRYDSSTNTLTLNGATITPDSNGIHDGGIEYTGSADFNVKILGTNKSTLKTDTGAGVHVDISESCTANINVTGNGSLTVVPRSSNSPGSAIMVEKYYEKDVTCDIVVNGPTIVATTGWGIDNRYGDVTIKNASFKWESSYDGAYDGGQICGINADGKLTVDNAKVELFSSYGGYPARILSCESLSMAGVRSYAGPSSAKYAINLYDPSDSEVEFYDYGYATVTGFRGRYLLFTTANLNLPSHSEYLAKQQQSSSGASPAGFINTSKVSAKQIKEVANSGLKSVTLGPKVKRIAKKAFKGTGITTVVIKTKKLKKSSVKGSLKGSKVKTVKVKIGSKKVNKKYVKKYKKIFTKKNAGKKVKVK